MFGLQAAPVKPRLDGWRHRWYTDRYSILGCDRHWFALGSCASFYPAHKDLTLWEALRRCNAAPLPDAEIEALIARAQPYYEPHGAKEVEEFTTFARLNLRNRVHTTRIHYYNRASTPVDEEFHTFLDEWCLGDFNTQLHAAHYASEVKVVPSPSFIDFALYWYGVSFDVAGNTGVYIDNNYFVPDVNTVMTNAYRRADGSIMPSNGCWGLRELAKRTFVYLNERGMLPIKHGICHRTDSAVEQLLYRAV